MAVTKDDIAVRLLLDETDAIKSLDAAITEATTFERKIIEISKFAEQMGDKFGVTRSKIIDALKAVKPETIRTVLPSAESMAPVQIPGETGQRKGWDVALGAAGQVAAMADKIEKAAQRKLALEEKIAAVQARAAERAAQKAERDEVKSALGNIQTQINMQAELNRLEQVAVKEVDAGKKALVQDKIANLRMQIEFQKELDLVAQKELDTKEKLLRNEAELAAKAKERGDAFASKLEKESQDSLNKEVQERAKLKQQAANEAVNEVKQVKLLEEAEKKSNNLSEKRKQTLAQIVQSRQKEIEAIRGQGSYLQQVASTQKLIEQLVEETGSNANQVGAELKNAFGFSQPVVDTAIGNITGKLKGLAGIAKDVFGNVRNYISTAFGTFVAMMLFQAQMMVSQFFQDILKQARDFGNSLQEMKLAERILSESGLDITNRQIIEITENLAKLYKTVSAVEIRGIFTDMALKLKDAGLSVKEMEELTRLVLDLKILNPETSLDTIADVVARGALTEETKALANLKFPVSAISSDKKLQQYALEKGIIKDINDELSEQEKIQLRVNYMIEQRQRLSEGTLEQQDALVNSGNRLDAAWKNFTENTLGVANYWFAILAILAEIFDFLSRMIDIIRGVRENVTATEQAFANIISKLSAILYLIPPYLIIQNTKNSIEKVYEFVTGRKFSDELDVPKLQEIDTPTAPTAPSTTPPIIPDPFGEENKADKIRELLKGLAEALDQFGDRARKAQEDFNLIWGKGGRAWEDYNRDVWEINRDINEKIRDANEKHRRDELDREAKFLERLRQLREKFLFSLEDALRERDARQVIRLTKQYEMDKAALIREEELRKKSDAEAAAQKIRDLEAERAKRLEQLNYEFELKRKREEEDYQISMRRLKEELDDKLQAISNNIAETIGVNEAGAKEIYDIISQIYGSNGSIESLVNYTYENMIKRTEEAFDRMVKVYEKWKTINDDVSKPSPGSSTTTTTPGTDSGRKGGRVPRRRPRGMAEGGAIIANTPTDIRFGEAGGEAMFVPLNKMTAFVSQSLSPKLGSGMNNGKLSVQVTISPDLRAEIIQKSLDEFAGVLEIVQRER